MQTQGQLFFGHREKAHVDAETDTEVLGMSREEYEALSVENPELRNFLSAVLTRRLGYSKVTGERTK